jgi:hypothetical protein
MQAQGSNQNASAQGQANQQAAWQPQYRAPQGFQIHPEFQQGLHGFMQQAALPPQHQQALIDLHAQQNARYQAAAAEQARAEQQAWQQAIMQDKEHGGERFPASQEAAKAFMSRFGNQELASLLQSRGLGYHPGLFRAFANAGSFIRNRMAEDSIAGRMGQPGVGPRAATEAERLAKLYDSPDMQKLRGK